MTRKNYTLTKSVYVRSLQCERAMYLDIYHPKLAHYSPETLQRFRHGRAFERSFKDTFPDAIDLNFHLGMNICRYPALTASLLQQEGPVEIFEAGFIHDDVLILADVVRKNLDGTLTIFEVKSSYNITDTLLNDVAIQYYVITHALPRIAHESLFSKPLRIKRFNLLCADCDYGFRSHDVTEQARRLAADIPQRLQHLKEVLRGPEPDIAPDTSDYGRCNTPYACPYQAHCLRHPSPAQEPVPSAQ